jgi:hypothetical protein
MTLPNVPEQRITPSHHHPPSPFLADNWEDALRQELYSLLEQGGLLCITLPQYEKGYSTLSRWYISEKKRVDALSEWASTAALDTINNNLQQQEPVILLDFLRTVQERTNEFKRTLQMKTLEVARTIAGRVHSQ